MTTTEHARRLSAIQQASRAGSESLMLLGEAQCKMLDGDALSLTAAAETVREAIIRANDAVTHLRVAEGIAADIERVTNARLGLTPHVPAAVYVGNSINNRRIDCIA
jgi:hypothetical protein